ncbi:hypothetical protein CWC22_024225 [Pseudoalteromonas rubra]|uniref:Uncharacterized protein n=1 Tax=Pseudoalteromonas rubra TaxID=43658 RepID=A0A5S3US75_9GAMM|nr:hypothetical protein [Pseudoalteromonas rubra]QPB86106.1 hypothetical protein CWC22_024225 [Pseudoalteromonas rubra]
MEINNWFDLFIYTLFTLGIVVLVLPAGIYYIRLSYIAFARYGFGKLPKGSPASGIAGSALGILFLGVFAILVSLWYLFLDKGGNLFYFYSEVVEFFQGGT